MQNVLTFLLVRNPSDGNFLINYRDSLKNIEVGHRRPTIDNIDGTIDFFAALTLVACFHTHAPTLLLVRIQRSASEGEDRRGVP